MSGTEAAKLIRVSEHVIGRAFQDGKLNRVACGGKIGFRKSEVEAFGRERLATLRGSDREGILGNRDAEILALFEKGVSIVDAVIQTRTPIDVVMLLHTRWADAKKRDAALVGVPKCACGAAASPTAAMCTTCFSRSRKLTDQERALLAGAALPDPRVCACEGCGGKFEASALKSLCAACGARLNVDLRGAQLVITLGANVLRTFSAQETMLIARAMQPRETPPASDPPPPSALKDEPVDEAIKKLRERYGIDESK